MAGAGWETGTADRRRWKRIEPSDLAGPIHCSGWTGRSGNPSGMDPAAWAREGLQLTFGMAAVARLLWGKWWPASTLGKLLVLAVIAVFYPVPTGLEPERAGWRRTSSIWS